MEKNYDFYVSDGHTLLGGCLISTYLEELPKDKLCIDKTARIRENRSYFPLTRCRVILMIEIVMSLFHTYNRIENERIPVLKVRFKPSDLHPTG